jgi:hypothetical protein
MHIPVYNRVRGSGQPYNVQLLKIGADSHFFFHGVLTPTFEAGRTPLHTQHSLL